MRRTLVLALVAALAVVAAGCRGGTSRKPPIHLNPNMDNQVLFKPQAADPFAADGRAARAPLAGTVRAGSYSTDEHLTAGTVGGQPAATLPPSIPLTTSLLLRGQQRYDIYCAPCHDVTGGGKGTVVHRGMLPPPTFHDARLRAQGVGYFYQVITNGVRNMPAYGAQVPVNDRWAIAAYVRALQNAHDARLNQIPADVAAAKGWVQ